MYPTIVIDRDMIVEAHRLAREIVRNREAAAVAASAVRPSKAAHVLRVVQSALSTRRWKLAA